MILGLDLSLNTMGFCLLDEKGKVIKKGTFNATSTGLTRLSEIAEAITKILLGYPDIDWVIEEGYAFQPFATNNTFSIGEAGGVVKLMIYQMGFPLLLVPPKQMKKFFTGNGNAKKPEIWETIRNKHGLKVMIIESVGKKEKPAMLEEMKKLDRKKVFYFATEHEADAYGLARLGLCLYKVWVKKESIAKYEKHQQEVYTAITTAKDWFV